MQEFSEIISQGSRHAWVFAPTALLLGVLHGLEPGHSKTLMAAFIIAVRGTVTQAILLGVSAALSHSAIVFFVVLLGLHFQANGDGAVPEPYFQIASASLMALVAVWMVARTYQGTPKAPEHVHDDRSAQGAHPHSHQHTHGSLFDGAGASAHGDAHARAHAAQIEKRFSGRDVTTTQIVVFGLTGGLIPCPAAITVLVLCLQVKEVALGVGLVACFSAGLAFTMVTVGVVAAIGARKASKRWSGYADFARRAPYVSGVLIIAFAIYLGYQGIKGLAALS